MNAFHWFILTQHAGDHMEASRWMEEARTLDTADRFVNCKSVKYLLRTNQVEKATETAGLFTRVSHVCRCVVHSGRFLWSLVCRCVLVVLITLVMLRCYYSGRLASIANHGRDAVHVVPARDGSCLRETGDVRRSPSEVP